MGMNTGMTIEHASTTAGRVNTAWTLTSRRSRGNSADRLGSWSSRRPDRRVHNGRAPQKAHLTKEALLTMSKIGSVVLLLLAAPAARAQQPLTLADATARALARNHDIRIEREAVDTASARALSAQGSYDPR